MTTDLTKPQPKTILDLKMRNYTVYMLDDLTQTRIEYLNGVFDEKKRLDELLKVN
jgi:hypothetical protein